MTSCCNFDALSFMKSVDDNDVETFLDLINALEIEAQDNTADWLSLNVCDDKPLIQYICTRKDVSPEFVKTLLHKGVSVNLPSTEGRPLQVACVHNCPATVKLLLEYGANIIQGTETVWGKQSPFYIASISGHLEVLRELISYKPKLIKDDGVRSCLLYAACFGGNLDVVKIWYSPGMDINHPREFVDSEDPLHNCGDDTPLFAACAGGHYDVARFLVELGAVMSRKVCEEFPDITGKILLEFDTHSMIDSVHTETHPSLEKYKVDFSKRSLGAVHHDWLQSFTFTLVELDLSRNNIEKLPHSIPWNFRNLEFLNISYNLVSSIESPEDNIQCNRLKEILMTSNRLTEVCAELFQLPALETLNLSHNQLEYLVKTHQHQLDWKSLQGTVGRKNREWTCTKLSRLNLSHNQLKMLPQEMKRCVGMTFLNASHNNIISFPGGWDCSLTNLDLSHNEMEMFPVDIHLFWCGSLKVINVDHNHLESLKESIVKLCVLTDLIASYNNISYLPEPEEWDCKQLYVLDLRNNSLGSREGNITPITPKKSPILQFRTNRGMSLASEAVVLPGFLEHCLHDLYLSNNQLDCVPKGICHLSSLVNLDISENPGIRELPKELGKLISISSLKIDGLKLSRLPSNLPTGNNYQRSKEIITHLQHELRKSKTYNKLKLVILGKKDKGKTTLAGLLQGNNGFVSYEETGINRFEFTMSQSKGINLFKKSALDIIFSVWDMASTEQYTAVQQCFFTQNSLYLLVWDVWSLKRELDKVGKLLYSIEAQTPNSRVILVATFLDKNVTSTRNVAVENIITEVVERYGMEGGSQCCRLDRENIIPVSCTTKEGIIELKQRIYEVASKIPDPLNYPKSLLSRKIPQSYIEVEKAIAVKLKNKNAINAPPFMEKNEFLELMSDIPGCDIDTPKEIECVTRFLVESGSLLHFSDQLKGLNNLYFIDPSWLCELLAKVLVEPDSITSGKIGAKEVKSLYENDSRFPSEHLEEYIQLLERFEIALSVDSGKKFFIPSQLSEKSGMELHEEERTGKSVCRLYQMAFIPSGFWTRLLTRIMARIELLEYRESWSLRQQSNGTFGINRLTHTIVGREISGSQSGLQIKKKDMVYWQSGMCVRHAKGFFKLESVKIPGKPPVNGILVVVHSHTEEFSVMGMIVDEIDDLLTDHYPGLLEWDQHGQSLVQRFALCPQCYDFTAHSLTNCIDHFTVEHCSRLILSSDTITCKTGVLIPLNHLVPELLIQELPKGYHLDQKKLTVDEDNFLGRGVSGSVYKGRYGDTDVAVKYYHDAQKNRSITGIPSNDSGNHSMKGRKTEENDENDHTEQTEESEATSEIQENQESSDIQNTVYINYKDVRRLMTYDNDEASSLKIWKTFMDMRQEVAVTSKLQHPCIVEFVGICVQPQLLMCLEFAPLGNLRNVLDDMMKDRKVFDKHRDRDKIFDPIFSKDMTYKLVLQMALGLEYLHKNNIIYRDLKSENILITTLDVSALVNLKLSDYGISKFYHSGGNIGMVGTPGYQAPEIMDGLMYDSKVDIFSFAMVIYEIVSGQRPFAELKNMSQIMRAMKTESKRPELKDFNIVTRFPLMESLMKKCWHDLGTERPSATTIISDHLKHVKFICLNEMFTQTHGEIDCICPITEGSGKQQLVWLWEGRDEERQYHIFDLSVSAYHVYNRSLPGDAVTCMCKVDKEIWVGTELVDDEGWIEIFDQKDIGNPKLHDTIKTNGVPTSVTYVVSEMDKKIYVTLHTGKLSIFSPMPKCEKDDPPPIPTRTSFIQRTTVTKAPETMFRQRQWQLKKSQQVAPDEATCLVYIPKQNEAWIGCGNQLIVYSNSRLLVEHRFLIQHIMRNPDIGDNWSVQTVQYSLDKVWCLLQNSTVFIEFDVESRVPLYIYDCDLRSPKGIVISRKVSYSPDDVPVEKERETENNCHQHEVFNNGPPPVPKRSTTDCQSSGLYDSCDMQIPPRPPRNKNGDSDIQLNQQTDVIYDRLSSGSGYEMPPPRLPSRKRTQSSESNDDLSQGQNSENTVLTRNTSASSRRSAFVRRPQASIPKELKYSTAPASGYRQSFGSIYLNSITVVGNTLWASRNINDIVVINIDSGNFQKGEVITVLDSKGPNRQSDIWGIETLVHIPGNPLVVSVMKDNLTTSRLQCWEAYNAENIKSIRKYWEVKKSGSKKPKGPRLSPRRAEDKELPKF